MVCDTPHDNDFLGGCGGNSCGTDTLSNYSSCGSEFTAGRVGRMRFHLNNYRNVLDFSNPNACKGSALINYITPGDSIISTKKPVTFTSNTTGVTEYE